MNRRRLLISMGHALNELHASIQAKAAGLAKDRDTKGQILHKGEGEP